jgi:predicted transcriptional regulator
MPTDGPGNGNAGRPGNRNDDALEDETGERVTHQRVTDEHEADVPERVAFLIRSPTRVRILDALAGDGPLDRLELRDRLDVVRTTLTRNLDPLLDYGWVVEGDDGYEVTLAGKAVYERFDALVETAAVASRLDPLCSRLPRDEFDLDVRHLSGATLAVASESDPYAPVNRHVEAVAGADRYRALLPAIGRRAMESAVERARDGAVHELVVGPDVADTLGSPAYRSLLETLLDTGRCRVRIADRTPPYFLGIFDGRVQIGVADERGVPQALVETGDEAVRSWAVDRYEAAEAAATPLDIEPE